MTKDRYFSLVSTPCIKGSRTVFVLQHTRLPKLIPFDIKECRISPSAVFPRSYSLFLPCTNFQATKTKGFLCAVKVEGDWNLGVLQEVKISGSFKANNYIGYFLIFKKGTTWDAVVTGFNTFIQTKAINYILKYVNPVEIEIRGEDIVGLVEVSRKFRSDNKPIHCHISSTDGCFDQPKSGPCHWWSASYKLFHDIFQTTKPYTMNGNWRRNKDVCLRKPHCGGQEKTTNPPARKRKRTLSKENFSLLEDIYRSMKNQKVVCSINSDQHVMVYYVKVLRVDDSYREKKYVLFPLQEGEKMSIVKTFAKVPSHMVNDGLPNLDGQAPSAYDRHLLHLSAGKTIDLYCINPSDHPNGFAIALLSKDEMPPKSSSEIFSNTFSQLFMEKRDGVFLDSDLEVGTVVYRGLPWMFEVPLCAKDFEFIEHMHGNEQHGMPSVRNSVNNFGFFSYTGPRASSQSSSSPLERKSVGHDLYTKQYRNMPYTTGLRIGNILCSQSDKMMRASGNVMMTMAAHHKNQTGAQASGEPSYSAICYNRIITKWFASVCYTQTNSLSL